MHQSDDLRQRLDQIRRTLRGEARSAALELHLEAAEAEGDRPLVNETLATLINSYEFSPDATRLLVPYAKFLHNYDTEPEHFDTELIRRLYWMFKWVVSKMTDHPDVPLASIEEAIAQMRRRYAEAGHSLHPVHESEYWLYLHIGDKERAARAAEAMLATEPDSMSNCEACRCNTLGLIAIERDDYERALADWSPILKGELRCAHEPHATLARSLLPLAALGRLDEARANHLHGYRISRDNDDMVRIIARHMRFCALTGNEARAVEILDAHARCFQLGLEPDVLLTFLEGVQVVCGSLRARGLGDTELTGPGGRRWNADELYAHADTERRAICERYDRRNGTDAVSRESQLAVDSERTYPHVPLGLKTFTAAPPAPEPVMPEPQAASLEALEAALVKARAANDAFAEDVMDHWKAVDRLVQALGVELEPADEANVLLGRIDESKGLDHSLELAAQVRERFTAAGQPGRALANLAATLHWRLQEDVESIPEVAAQVLAEAPAHAATEPVFAFRARAAALSALLLHCRSTGAQPGPELLAQVEALDAELAAAPENRRNTLSRTQLAMYFAGCVNEPEPRLHAFRKAFELASAGEHRQELFSCSIEYGSILNGTGSFEEAIRVAETGLANSGPGSHPFALAVLHLTITECTTNLGIPAKAEAHAIQAAHYYDQAGERGCAGVARHLLGVALARQGRHQEAVVIFEAALADLPEMHEHEHWRLVDSHGCLAESYHQLRELRPALHEALEALKLMDGGLAHRDRTYFARIAHLAGTLLERIGEFDDAILTYRRSMQAWRELGAFPTAANAARAAMWVELRHGTGEPVTAGMRTLAAELREHWQDAELPPGYREACRHELAKTLMQHANMLVGEQDARGLGTPEECQALNEEALRVLLDGEFDGSLGAQAVSQLLDCLEAQGENPDDWEAAATDAIKRLGLEDHEPVKQMITEQLDRMRHDYDEYEAAGS
ncbi:tetratricopeptide repeat protein [Glycomyces luteolus]|uniref:Tetratricopeptide repeat protein n=1 Tax=Glycomyces luteolus TaxID=2670330 RepID=A0A9X3PAP2_9ACTN|nr:tetratricopeptide repeat protein [Glycomyces luteolus]MDA1359059.1 tetratricopeptide repeat protein [Glycomyces luteolus]